jgi:AcrR family transcriptional regulator
MILPDAPASDRRQRKSRTALQQALLTLIAEKPYAEVTIEDITERADVARATFYAHYRDKPTLLHEVCKDLVEGLTKLVGTVAAQSAVYTGSAVIATFEHAGSHPDLYRLVLSGEGGTTVRTELIAAFEHTLTAVFSKLSSASPSTPRVPLSMTTTAFVGAVTMTLETWLRDQPGQEPANTALQFLHGQVGGLEWSLGFEPGETRFEQVPSGARS